MGKYEGNALDVVYHAAGSCEQRGGFYTLRDTRRGAWLLELSCFGSNATKNKNLRRSTVFVNDQ